MQAGDQMTGSEHPATGSDAAGSAPAGSDAGGSMAVATYGTLGGSSPQHGTADRLCARCGTYVTAEALIDVEKSLCGPCVLARSPKPPFSPRLLFLIAFLLSFLPAGILHALNYRRYGVEARVGLRIAAVSGLFVLFFAIIMILPENTPSSLSFVINGGIGAYFLSSQKGMFEIYERAGGKAASPWKAIGLSIALAAFSIVVVGGAYIVHDYVEATAADDAMARGDYVEARQRMHEVCEDDNGVGCATYGILLEHGKGGSVDVVRAREYYRRGCDLDTGVACGNLGVLLENGSGGDADVEGARGFYERGCELEDGFACNNLGVLLHNGEGRSERARELFDRACGLGVELGCENLAVPVE